MPPTIALTTDFGTRDPYVAQLKGVLLSEGPPGLRLVDLSHEISPHNAREAALFLRAAVPRFAQGTVHLVVIDPGVGGERAGLIVRARGQFLVGPDNGIFGYLFDGEEEAFAIDPARLGERTVAPTFHGRDLFAPVAARLAAGTPPAELGRPARGYAHLVFPLVEMQGQVLHGQVIHVDRFGNLITNITEEVLAGFLPGQERRRALVRVKKTDISGIGTHYAQVANGSPLALVGSAGLLEIAAREESAAARLRADVGERVTLLRRG